MSCTVNTFGTYKGTRIYSFTLTNKNGMSAVILNFGGILQSLRVPGKDGNFADVVCGFDTIEDYLADDQYFGSLVGRYANRIAGGKFTLGGKEYVLNCNEEGVTHLHGGKVGYNRKIWGAEPSEENGNVMLDLILQSFDGEEGYPADLDMRVRYTLTPDNTLSIKYSAKPSADTVVNLTNHSYFNMAGYASGNIAGHIVQVDADRYTEVDKDLIPTGKLPKVADTKFDLRKPVSFKEDFDHNFVLNGWDGTLRHAADFFDPISGRGMEVLTTLPGIQLYSAVNMCGDVKFKGGVPQKKHSACCFETQFFPDSPNHPEFPSCVFGKDKPYESETVFRFYTK